jgi:L-seryl-tRNA(Ser) seleniumtransferase
MKRRNALKNLSLLPFVGTGLATVAATGTAAATQTNNKRNLFEELGVTPVINASVTMTFLSGSLMLPEVLEAINSTSHDFANMYELQDKVGAKIAEMLQCEAAMVTSGAACAMLLGTAAAITGTDPVKIKQLPAYTGSQPEVIMQKSHRYLFDQAITTTGAKIVEVEGPAAMENAINSNTVMALYYNAADQSSVTREEFVAITKKHKVISFIDAAADVPPVENLFRFQKMGFDLVTFSGGKMIRGPQSAGLLLGRKDLIEAARLNHSPHEAPIGRPMKVNKEEMFGMYAALKAYLERDHQKEWQEWLARVDTIKLIVEKVKGVKGELFVYTGEANAFPSLYVNWDHETIKMTAAEVAAALQKGTPSIVATTATKGTDNVLNIGVVLLRPDQVKLVGKRVKEILESQQ